MEEDRKCCSTFSPNGALKPGPKHPPASAQISSRSMKHPVTPTLNVIFWSPNFTLAVGVFDVKGKDYSLAAAPTPSRAAKRSSTSGCSLGCVVCQEHALF